MRKFNLWLLLICFGQLNAIDYRSNFNNNAFFNDRLHFQIAPYLLPSSHPLKAVLDALFSQRDILESQETLVNAGFEIIAGPMLYSYVIVARHPAVPGYVFKLYTDSETRLRKEIPHWVWLVRRCAGAQGIREIIRRNNIIHFTVPDKWLYPLSTRPYSSILNPQPVILIETDMQPESSVVTERMWKEGITRLHLKELCCILKEGYGGSGTINLLSNVPFTKAGKFAFTDTEDPRTDVNLEHVKKYLSKEMQRYWQALITDPELRN